jgi:hypothetical protein
MKTLILRDLYGDKAAGDIITLGKVTDKLQTSVFTPGQIKLALSVGLALPWIAGAALAGEVGVVAMELGTGELGSLANEAIVDAVKDPIYRAFLAQGIPEDKARRLAQEHAEGIGLVTTTVGTVALGVVISAKVGSRAEKIGLEEIKKIAPDAEPIQNESGHGLDAIGHSATDENVIWPARSRGTRRASRPPRSKRRSSSSRAWSGPRGWWKTPSGRTCLPKSGPGRCSITTRL